MSRFNLSAWAVAHRSLTGFLIALLFIAGLFATSASAAARIRPSR